MALSSEDFLPPKGVLPSDLLGKDDDLEDHIDEWLAEVSTRVTSAVAPSPAADDVIRHGVYALAYKAAAAYWAKRPTSATLADQGSASWTSPATVYAELAKAEEAAFVAGMKGLQAAIAALVPGGSVPTVILP